MNNFLLICLVSALSMGTPSSSHAVEGKLSEDNLKATRREAAWKKRRVIMNNDGNDSRGAANESREAFLASRSTPLIGSHVDTIMYCDGIWGTFTHLSPTAELRASSDNNYREWAVDLIKDGGPDPLGTIIDFGRKNGIEVFWSLRMNDTHDSSDPTMMSKWKKSNTDCLVGDFAERRSYKGGGRRWSAVDYANEAVRKRTIGWFDEVGANYDVDGFELDFFRHPIFFRNPLLGKPASDENCRQMTEVIRSIRKIADKHALRVGHPILVTVRLPDSAGYCRDIGLDIETWLKEGLIDMMTVSGYFRLNHWQSSVELGHRYDVPVFAGLSESRVRKPVRAFKNTPSEYRGRAYAAWKEGVDAVYTFNLFNPQSPVFREIGDPATLARMEKVYTTGARGIRGADAWLVGGGKHSGCPLPLCDKPQKLSGDSPVKISINIWDDLAGRAAGKRAVATFGLTGLSAATDLNVAINGHVLEDGKLQGDQLSCPLPADNLKIGENVFTFTLKGTPAKPVVLDDLFVLVPEG